MNQESQTSKREKEKERKGKGKKKKKKEVNGEFRSSLRPENSDWLG